MIRQKKVSELPEATSIEGLVSLGVDASNKSVKVPINLLKGNQGAGVPTGGAAGDVLVKNSNADHDTYFCKTVLPVTMVQTTSTNLVYSFGAADYNSVKISAGKGLPIAVKITDNRKAAYKQMDLSGIYPAVYNTIISQIEIPNVNIAKGFYLNATVPSTRGCVTGNTQLYILNGATFDRETGYYTLNGIQLSETEIQQCFAMSPTFFSSGDRFQHFMARTNFPILRRVTFSEPMDLSYFLSYGGAYSAPYLEVFTFHPYATSGIPTVHVSNITGLFNFSVTLREVIGILDIVSITTPQTNVFNRADSLETIFIKRVKISLNMDGCPNMSRESILYMINNSANTSPITLALHAAAFGRLSPEDIALSSSKNITLTA